MNWEGERTSETQFWLASHQAGGFHALRQQARPWTGAPKQQPFRPRRCTTGNEDRVGIVPISGTMRNQKVIQSPCRHARAYRRVSSIALFQAELNRCEPDDRSRFEHGRVPKNRMLSARASASR